MDTKTENRRHSTKMVLLVNEVFRRKLTWYDLAELFVTEESALREEVRQYYLSRFDDGEERLKKLEDQIAENERIQLKELEIDLRLRKKEET